VVPGASVAVAAGDAVATFLAVGMAGDWLPVQPAKSAAPAIAHEKDWLNRKFT
jgi:hypothetical protein